MATSRPASLEHLRKVRVRPISTASRTSPPPSQADIAGEIDRRRRNGQPPRDVARGLGASFGLPEPDYMRRDPQPATGGGTKSRWESSIAQAQFIQIIVAILGGLAVLPQDYQAPVAVGIAAFTIWERWRKSDIRKRVRKNIIEALS